LQSKKKRAYSGIKIKSLKRGAKIMFAKYVFEFAIMALIFVGIAYWGIGF